MDSKLEGDPDNEEVNEQLLAFEKGSQANDDVPMQSSLVLQN